MFVRKPLSFVAIVTILLQTTACHTWVPLERGLEERWTPSPSNPDRFIRVHTNDGESITLQNGWLESERVGGDHLQTLGWNESALIPVSFALSDVTLLEVRQRDEGRTKLAKGIAVGGVVLAIGIGVYIHAMMSMW